jgi:uncharacterized protein YjbJ (UPF0337 family)
MNTLEIKGCRNLTKSELKQKWTKLENDDLQYVKGRGDELLGQLQRRTGKTNEVIEKVIKDAFPSPNGFSSPA